LRLLLDADVLIGALDRDDKHHRQARQLFTTWRRQQAVRTISVVNLTEVLIAPARDRAKLMAAREAIAALGVSVHHPNEAIGVDAARLRQRHPISLPDAYCLATARHTGATLVSFDRKVLRASEHERINVP
jgi:predicted nucleic acid-binding protein